MQLWRGGKNSMLTSKRCVFLFLGCANLSMVCLFYKGLLEMPSMASRASSGCPCFDRAFSKDERGHRFVSPSRVSLPYVTLNLQQSSSSRVRFRREPESAPVSPKTVDVAALGNLCLDIVLSVPSLPPSSAPEKYAYMKALEKSPPEQRFWEAGGNCNFVIAAARLGLSCVTVGHVGNEDYGRFMRQILDDEGVDLIGILDQDCKLDIPKDTLLCWVLVDPEHQHGFCSRFDFMTNPVFSRVGKLPSKAERIIKQSEILFCNGFIFDELSPAVICSAIDAAKSSGSAVFFDPGPRGKALCQGTAEQQNTIKRIASMSNVLLLTEDEAETLTGIADPSASAKTILERGEHTEWVIIKMGEKGCLMATCKGLYYAPAFRVNVADTVGCGDSFAAAIALGYTRKYPIAAMLILANAVGAATAMGCGAGRNVATWDQVIELLKNADFYEDNDITEALFRNQNVETSSVNQLGWTKSLIDAAAKETLRLLLEVKEGHNKRMPCRVSE